jgi:hypothetical protein
VHERPGSRDLGQQPVARDPVVEPHAVGETPAVGGVPQTSEVWALAVHPQRRVVVADVAERANGEVATFPGEQPADQDHVAGPLAHRADAVQLHGGGIGQHVDRGPGAQAPRDLLVLGEDDDRGVGGKPHRRKPGEQSPRGDAEEVVERTPESQLGHEAERWLHTPSHRSPHQRLGDGRHPCSGPDGGQAHMVDDVEVDPAVQLERAPGRGALPAVVVPVELRPPEPFLVVVERDRFHVDTGRQGVAGQEPPEDRNADRASQHPCLMALGRGQQGAESDLTLGALVGLTGEG